MSYNIQRKQLQNPLSASYADTASYVNPLLQDVQITGSILLSGSATISTVEYIDFRKVPVGSEPAHLEGRLHWYDDTKTLQIDTDKNDFMIEIGHQNVVRVYNDTGVDIVLGKVVRINGSQGNQPTVVTASWTDDTTSASTLGFAATTILGAGGNKHGYVITNGLIRNVNTVGYPVGTQLYLSSSGNFTSTPPDAPLHEVRLGKVIKTNALGIIFVDIMNGYELDELHDLKTTTATAGDLLIYSSSLWTNSKQLTGSYGLTGSLRVTNGGITSSLFGTASWAYSSSNAITSSHALYADAANVSNNSNYSSAAGFAGQVAIQPFQTLTDGIKNYFTIFDGLDDPNSAANESVYNQSLFTFQKDTNQYEFLATEDTKIAPDIVIGEDDSVNKASVFVHGNVVATGIITAPNLATGLNTLNFVSDYTRPTESIQASLGVSAGSLVLSATSFVTSMLTLSPIHPLPANPATGSFAVSASSPPKPYFYNGTSWNPLY